jgi:FixJ family two-component response regulator
LRVDQRSTPVDGGRAPQMIILDDDDDLLESMGGLIELTSQRPCVKAHSLEELMSQRSKVLGCKTAILDINLGEGQPSGVDAYHWLKEQGFRGNIIFLTGHARSHPLVALAHHFGDARVLEKPIEFDQLVALTKDGAPHG